MGECSGGRGSEGREGYGCTAEAVEGAHSRGEPRPGSCGRWVGGGRVGVRAAHVSIVSMYVRRLRRYLPFHPACYAEQFWAGKLRGTVCPTAASRWSVQVEAAKLRPSPDAARGTAQPEVTPAGHRVQGPGYGQKPRARGCDAAKQLTQGHLRAARRQLRLHCRRLRLSQSPVRSLRLRGKRPVLLMPSLAVCCGSGVHSPHDAAARWAPAEGSEMARSPFRVCTRGQGSIQHHRKLCLR